MMIDTHLHVWDSAAVPIAWLGDAGMDATADVPDKDDGRRYVLVEADADDPGREADWLSGVASQDSRIHGVVASVALEASGADEELARVAALPGVVGIRRLLQDRKLFDDANLLVGMKRLATYKLPFDACVRAAELPELVRLLERVPELTVLLDHMGKPDISDKNSMRRWRKEIARLAELPQVHCKLSGLPAQCRDTSELDRVAGALLLEVVELFGPDRCLLGSDHPVSLDPGDWCLRVLKHLPGEWHRAIAEENALRLYARRRH